MVIHAVSKGSDDIQIIEYMWWYTTVVDASDLESNRGLLYVTFSVWGGRSASASSSCCECDWADVDTASGRQQRGRTRRPDTALHCHFIGVERPVVF